MVESTQLDQHSTAPSQMQTIERTFSVLRAISESDASVGVSEIARRCGLAKSTTSRILVSLDDLGMIERLDDRYVIGLGLASLTAGAKPSGSLRDLARPHLVDLAEELGESVALAVLDGDEMVYIDTAVSEGAVQVRDWTGERFPPHTTAAGLVLMTAWSTDRIERYSDDGLVAYTDRTLSDAESLVRRVEQVRAAGSVWTMGEFDDEVNGVAAGVLTSDGALVGAVNISGPQFRFPEAQGPEVVTSALTAACTQISSRILFL